MNSFKHIASKFLTEFTRNLQGICSHTCDSNIDSSRSEFQVKDMYSFFSLSSPTQQNTEQNKNPLAIYGIKREKIIAIKTPAESPVRMCFGLE